MLQTHPARLINETPTDDSILEPKGRTMDIGSLQQHANEEIRRFESGLEDKDYDEVLFLYMSRISEEIGNLASGVMGKEGLKPGKTVTDDDTSLAFAEAMYSIVTLAQKMDVDLEQAMQLHLEKKKQEREQEEMQQEML
ncbi:hypothetical protein KY327_00695 [Candidatus Woesearchaeota archaeon]|nr:hypothetical protein [Candidatus Woesearchaeota archaeon]